MMEEKMLDRYTEEVFRHYKELRGCSHGKQPQVTYVMHDLKEKGFGLYQQMRQLWKRLRTRSELPEEVEERRSHDDRYYDRTVLSGAESDSQTGSACEDCLHT